MKKVLTLIAGLLVCVQAQAFSITTNSSGTVAIGRQSRSQLIEVVRLDITSHASTGAAVATLAGCQGYLVRMVHKPVAAASPTDNYDFTLPDEAGVDTLSGAGANLSATTAADAGITIDGPGTNDHLPVAVNGDLIVTMANMGNSKQIKIWLYFEVRRRD